MGVVIVGLVIFAGVVGDVLVTPRSHHCKMVSMNADKRQLKSSFNQIEYTINDEQQEEK